MGYEGRRVGGIGCDGRGGVNGMEFGGGGRVGWSMRGGEWSGV